jgi:MazG family protein
MARPMSDFAKTVGDLIAIMAALRTPGTGCPWDLEQSFASIAPYTIEEAYEVADAIARGDLTDLKEELGDLLLQVVYHARLAEEQGAFDFSDVVDAIATKMIRRHPHVFGDEAVRAAGSAKGWWERIKAEEKAAKDQPDGQAGVLDDVPVALPALTRAVKLQDKAARVGFDWPSLAPVVAKMKEELAELEEIVSSGVRPAGSDPNAKVEEEFGDLLFVIANVARHLKLDPEGALRMANQKFIRRFRYIEERLAQAGKTPDQSNLEEMDALWNEAKARERGVASPRRSGGEG